MTDIESELYDELDDKMDTIIFQDIPGDIITDIWFGVAQVSRYRLQDAVLMSVYNEIWDDFEL